MAHTHDPTVAGGMVRSTQERANTDTNMYPVLFANEMTITGSWAMYVFVMKFRGKGDKIDTKQYVSNQIEDFGASGASF